MRLDDPGPYSLDRLRALPRPTLYTTDPGAWRQMLVERFEALTGRTLYPAQVETLLIEFTAYAMGVLGVEAQMTAEEHLVAFASERGLELLGANRSTPRLPAASARTRVRFSIGAPIGVAMVIAAGTRIGGGVASGATFATIAPAVIPAGATTAEVDAVATTIGAAANGFAPGQLTIMLDPVAGVSVTNLTASDGGADIEAVDAWRLRVANAHERISTMGSRTGYRETAMGVSAAIIDVAVVRPQPCHIDIYALTATGAAGANLMAAIAAAFDADAVLDWRFGDLVTVKSPTPWVASPAMTVRVRTDAAGIGPTAFATANGVFDRWRRRLGATVAPSEIIDAVRALDGVVDVSIAGLTFNQLSPWQFASGVLSVSIEVVA